MAKFYGPVGYAEQLETTPGVWTEKIVEHMYAGDLLENRMRYQSADKLMDDLNIANEVSILADPFAMENFHKMRYVGFQGSLWKISGVKVLYPRLILTIGGVYNGEIKTETSDDS